MVKENTNGKSYFLAVVFVREQVAVAFIAYWAGDKATTTAAVNTQYSRKREGQREMWGKRGKSQHSCTVGLSHTYSVYVARSFNCCFYALQTNICFPTIVINTKSYMLGILRNTHIHRLTHIHRQQAAHTHVQREATRANRNRAKQIAYRIWFWQHQQWFSLSPRARQKKGEKPAQNGGQSQRSAAQSQQNGCAKSVSSRRKILEKMCQPILQSHTHTHIHIYSHTVVYVMVAGTCQKRLTRWRPTQTAPC